MKNTNLGNPCTLGEYENWKKEIEATVEHKCSGNCGCNGNCGDACKCKAEKISNKIKEMDEVSYMYKKYHNEAVHLAGREEVFELLKNDMDVEKAIELLKAFIKEKRRANNELKSKALWERLTDVQKERVIVALKCCNLSVDDVLLKIASNGAFTIPNIFAETENGRLIQLPITLEEITG